MSVSVGNKINTEFIHRESYEFYKHKFELFYNYYKGYGGEHFEFCLQIW